MRPNINESEVNRLIAVKDLKGATRILTTEQRVKMVQGRAAIDAYCILHKIPIEKVSGKKETLAFCPSTVYRDADGTFRYQAGPCNEVFTYHGAHGCPAYPKHVTRKHLGFVTR
jgi:hypothetical protein